MRPLHCLPRRVAEAVGRMPGAAVMFASRRERSARLSGADFALSSFMKSAFQFLISALLVTQHPGSALFVHIQH